MATYLYNTISRGKIEVLCEIYKHGIKLSVICTRECVVSVKLIHHSPVVDLWCGNSDGVNDNKGTH